MTDEFQLRQSNSGLVHQMDGDGYRLLLDKSQKGRYSLAQIDDYLHLPRFRFPHKSPTTFQLEARVSDQIIPGTWGFGLWNDPFGMGIGGGGMPRILPVLPNAAWFFFGSNENSLTLREDQPGKGFHVKTFRSPLLPSFVSLFGLPLAPFAFWQKTAKILRRLGRVVIKEDGMQLNFPVDIWHVYGLNWKETQVKFYVDNNLVFLTTVAPMGRLGMVVWIDNQYFRFDREGNLAYGILETVNKQWMEVRNIRILED